MKKRNSTPQNRHYNHHHDHSQDIEIHKAVAQAMLSHVSDASSRLTGSEFDARRAKFQHRPSRFKLEAIKKATKEEEKEARSIMRWDVKDSLLDAYEIIMVSMRLERGSVLDYEFSRMLNDHDHGVVGRKWKGKNTLRKLLDHMSSRRFNEPIKLSVKRDSVESELIY